MHRTRLAVTFGTAALTVLILAACDQAAPRAPQGALMHGVAEGVATNRVPQASAASCEDAADATIRIVARAFPTVERPVRQALIDQCHIHPWDEEERRCIVAAETQRGDKELVGALGACHHAGDCRRHPDWAACRASP